MDGKRDLLWFEFPAFLSMAGTTTTEAFKRNNISLDRFGSSIYCSTHFSSTQMFPIDSEVAQDGADVSTGTF